MSKEISYSIEEENIDGRLKIIKAGNKWTDENKVLRYEGFQLKIPGEIRHKDKIVFAVLGIEKTREYDVFRLHLHSHDGDPNLDYDIKKSEDYCYIDDTGDINTTIKITKDLLKSWTNLTDSNIDSAFKTLNLDNSYNLLVLLPRTITLLKQEVILRFNQGKLSRVFNVCSDILENKHPIDGE